tara:strand:- start:120 stop:512 length:393 start_codon:yes stop_codon:yes gene_type:complete
MNQTIDMIAKRVAPNFPAWDLYADGIVIGVMTDFEGEGPVATVKTQTKGQETVAGDDIKECLGNARAVFELGHATYDPYHMTEEEARREAEAEAIWEAEVERDVANYFENQMHPADKAHEDAEYALYHSA